MVLYNRLSSTLCISQIQHYIQESSVSLTIWVLYELMFREHLTCRRCFVFTNLPTTSPCDLISKSNIKGTPSALFETTKPSPAPYKGTFFPSMFIRTVRQLFLGWQYDSNCMHNCIYNSHITRVINKSIFGVRMDSTNVPQRKLKKLKGTMQNKKNEYSYLTRSNSEIIITEVDS